MYREIFVFALVLAPAAIAQTIVPPFYSRRFVPKLASLDNDDYRTYGTEIGTHKWHPFYTAWIEQQRDPSPLHLDIGSEHRQISDGTKYDPPPFVRRYYDGGSKYNPPPIHSRRQGGRSKYDPPPIYSRRESNDDGFKYNPPPTYFHRESHDGDEFQHGAPFIQSCKQEPYSSGIKHGSVYSHETMVMKDQGRDRLHPNDRNIDFMKYRRSNNPGGIIINTNKNILKDDETNGINGWNFSKFIEALKE